MAEQDPTAPRAGVPDTPDPQDAREPRSLGERVAKLENEVLRLRQELARRPLPGPAPTPAQTSHPARPSTSPRNAAQNAASAQQQPATAPTAQRPDASYDPDLGPGFPLDSRDLPPDSPYHPNNIGRMGASPRSRSGDFQGGYPGSFPGSFGSTKRKRSGTFTLVLYLLYVFFGIGVLFMLFDKLQ